MRINVRLNRWLAASLFLLLAAECLASRDPFRPVEAACLPEPLLTASWQLKGIVGQKQDYRVLLLTTAGKWVQRGQGEPVDERWYLLNIEPLSITLGDRKGCRTPVSLKGSLYEKDSLPAAAPLFAPLKG